MDKFMEVAIKEALLGVEKKRGGPFGAVVVKDGQIIGKGHNNVSGTKDPSAHAEIIAIREASKVLNDFDLSGCDIYTTCEPCSMCLGAIIWAKIDRIYYGTSKKDIAKFGFDNHLLSKILPRQEHDGKPELIQIHQKECLEIFEEYHKDKIKQLY